MARCLAVADTAGIAVAVTLIAASLVRGGPAGGTGVLWVPGILLLAGAGEQRIAAGIFLFFFAMHLYAALASGQVGQQVTRKST